MFQADCAWGRSELIDYKRAAKCRSRRRLPCIPVASAMAPAAGSRGGRQLELQSGRARAARQLTAAMPGLSRRQPITDPFVLAPRNLHAAKALAACQPA